MEKFPKKLFEDPEKDIRISVKDQTRDESENELDLPHDEIAAKQQEIAHLNAQIERFAERARSVSDADKQTFQDNLARMTAQRDAKQADLAIALDFKIVDDDMQEELEGIRKKHLH
jgi:hypothetical protein